MQTKYATRWRGKAGAQEWPSYSQAVSLKHSLSELRRAKVALGGAARSFRAGRMSYFLNLLNGAAAAVHATPPPGPAVLVQPMPGTHEYPWPVGQASPQRLQSEQVPIGAHDVPAGHNRGFEHKQTAFSVYVVVPPAHAQLEVMPPGGQVAGHIAIRAARTWAVTGAHAPGAGVAQLGLGVVCEALTG